MPLFILPLPLITPRPPYAPLPPYPLYWQQQAVYPDLEPMLAPRSLPDLEPVSARARLLLYAHALALHRLHGLLHGH